MSVADYKIFLYYLFIYLTPSDKVLQRYPNLPFRLHAKDLFSEISLLSYCLMPNHFHFLIQQTPQNAIPRFMKQITNAYTEYFNKKYKRDGGLMQGKYKAVQIETDELLMHVSRYIHLNPIVANLSEDIETYEWSSIREYTKNWKGICRKELVLSQFSTPKKYKLFLEDHLDYARQLENIKHLTIDE